MSWILNKKDTIIWVCSTCIRLFGASGTLVAFLGHPTMAFVSGLIVGAAFELKVMLESKKRPNA